MNKRGVLVIGRGSGGGYTYKCLKHLGLLVSVVSIFFFGILFSTDNTHATSFSINTGTDPVLELNLSSNLLELNLTPKPNTPAFSTTDLTITAGTNNLTGYTLYMNVDNPNLSRSEQLPNNTTPSINSLVDNTTGYTEVEFTTNSWGYHLSGDTNYFAIPTTQLQLSTSTEPVNANSTTITFASKVDMSQPAGTYATNITLYAITNAPIPTMQDIDNWRGSLAENQSIRAVDSRDGKYYWVLKAKDGHIWMTQNLDFDIDSTKTYTPQDTDLTSDWTPIRSTINATGGTISGWANDDNTPYSFDVGNWYWNNTWYNSSECLIGNNDQTCNYTVGNANGKFSQTPYSGNGTHGHVGNYYNWSAAVAMNDTSSYTTSTYDNVANNPQTSICPAGWRLPTISSVASKNEFANFFTAYNNNTTDKIVVASPIFFIRGGAINSGALRNAGYSGGYQSSTVYSNKYLYVSALSSDNANPGVLNNRLNSWSVRCLARSTTTITFDANGGEGTMSPQTIGEFETGTLNANTFIRAGYTFAGWNTKADGSGITYQNLADYDGESTTLYAQWEELPYMQNITATTCPAERTLVYDRRDGKPYYIQKITTGSITLCWMTSNLNIAGGTTLTPENSNVTSSYTLPASSKTGFSNGGVAYVYNDNTYGGYYSYVAVTAGVNPSSVAVDPNSPSDICPKNWRLPTQDEYAALAATYTTGEALAGAPWYGLYGGLGQKDTIGGIGQRGDYYSATQSNGSRAQRLYFAKTTAGIYTWDKAIGCNVRCIAK